MEFVTGIIKWPGGQCGLQIHGMPLKVIENDASHRSVLK